LRSVPGFDLVLRKLFGLIGERSIRLIYLGSAVRVGPNQFRALYQAYEECLEVFDISDRPELYVSQTPFVNAGAIGVDRPFIVLNSATLTLLEPEEMRVILGHEIGHILSGHALYKTMLQLLVRLSLLAVTVPVASWTLMAVIAALKEWDRKSELSADRAGLLVSQDPGVSYRVQMKLAGGPHIDEMNLDEFLRQADEYEAGGDVLDSVFKLLNIVAQSHPFPVLRVAELKRWVDRGDYARVLSGDYPRRTEDPQVSILEELRSSARSYREQYDESRDPLSRFFKDLGGSVSAAGEKVWNRFSRRE